MKSLSDNFELYLSQTKTSKEPSQHKLQPPIKEPPITSGIFIIPM